MKHQHWSFKANTETFDGRRAVKEAWAAGLQVVTFETETHAVTLTTEDMYVKLVERSVAVSVIETLDSGQCFYPDLDVSGVGAARDRSADDLPPYTVWLDAGADDVREMIAKLRKPQRVAVSGYGPAPADNPEPKDNPAAEPTPIAPFVWQGEGVYCRRNGMRSTLTRRRGYEGDYPLRDADGEDYDLNGCLYQGERHDADFIGGKVADL